MKNFLNKMFIEIQGGKIQETKYIISLGAKISTGTGQTETIKFRKDQTGKCLHGWKRGKTYTPVESET